ncbi:MAG TPA: hypothetical protein VF472_22710 [Burkholderiaceae bacterium]
MPSSFKKYGFAFFLLLAGPVYADNTELEVYRGEIADEGEANVDIAANLMQSPRHDDGHGASVFQGVAELSYGLDGDWEIGLKLPVYAFGGAWHAEGMLTEIKYVASHDKSGWYAGAEIEAGYETVAGENEHWTIEAVPIIGWRDGRWDFTINPGVTLASGGDLRGKVLFEPAAKISYQVAPKSALGVEYFSEAGPVSKMLPASRRNELAFLALDAKAGKSTINLGVGHGVNAASPGWALKTTLDLEFD